jgi:hypothetical protein
MSARRNHQPWIPKRTNAPSKSSEPALKRSPVIAKRPSVISKNMTIFAREYGVAYRKLIVHDGFHRPVTTSSKDPIDLHRLWIPDSIRELDPSYCAQHPGLSVIAFEPGSHLTPPPLPVSPSAPFFFRKVSDLSFFAG